MAEARMVMTRLEEADKMLRRGELNEARAVYQALLPDAPPDLAAALQMRIQRVEELAVPGEKAVPKPTDTTVQARAEAAANAGNLDEAIGLYASVVSNRPDDQLARERLLELLLQAARPSQRPSQTPAPAPTPAVPVASAAPPVPAAAARLAPPLPEDPVELLQVLLERVRTNRRAPSMFEAH